MLLSMTGFGEAHRQGSDLSAAVEVRTINSRYFKLTLRCAEGHTALEPQIEAVVRQQIKRGTVQVSLRVDRAYSPDDFLINTDVLLGYRKQLDGIRQTWHLSEGVQLPALLALPGVIREGRQGPEDAQAQWPVVEEALTAALENMAHMRSEEGAAMAADLQRQCADVGKQLSAVEVRAPLVVDAYRQRMIDRVGKALEAYHVSLQPGDVVREIAVFSERSDISEEIVRLRSHMDQFAAIMQHEESSGRKLDFLTQEMFREANTIGSKANDVEIARSVIEIKAAIERIREMIQNVE